MAVITMREVILSIGFSTVFQILSLYTYRLVWGYQSLLKDLL